MKTFKIITGVVLLLISLLSGLALLFTEFVLFTEYPSIVFHLQVFVPLTVFLASAVAAAFFTPRCFQFYLLLVSSLCSLYQIGCFYWTPLLVAVAALLSLVVMRSYWLRWALFISAASFALLVVDAFAFHHRIAVLAHSAHSLVEFDHDPKTLRSPSGKTTAYLISGGFLDAFYTVCISGNKIMPESRIITPAAESSVSTDMIARWDGPIFLAGDKLVSLAYDERSGKVIDRESYSRGGIRVHDEEFMKHIKSPEAFAEYLLALPPKN